MGFFRGPDRIGQLSHSGGVITLGLPAGSLVNRYTVRGQQYDFGVLTRTISADVTLAANTLYMVYAQVIGGSVQLRISTLNRSAYLAANPTSELIGAFVTNHVSAFLLFVDINTTSPTINGLASKTAVQTFPNTLPLFLTNYASSDLSLFDLTNGYARVPLSGRYRAELDINMSGFTGTANTLSSNMFSVLGYKPTLPSGAADFTNSDLTNDNGPWVAAVNQTRNHRMEFDMAAGGYVWGYIQSNITATVSILNAKLILNLVSIPNKLMDL